VARKRRASGGRSPPPLIECRFLVPLVRDSDRRPHALRHWKALEDALFRHFDGFAGPEGPVPGNYKNRSGRRVSDLSRRYTIALLPNGVDALRRLLRRVANTFDQECIYLVVGVEVELVDADPSAGELGDS
jgi:hypothetical protein